MAEIKNFMGLILLIVFLVIGAYFYAPILKEEAIYKQEKILIQSRAEQSKKINEEKQKLAFNQFLDSCRGKPEHFDCQMYLSVLGRTDMTATVNAIEHVARTNKNQSVWHSLFGDS